MKNRKKEIIIERERERERKFIKIEREKVIKI